MADRLAPISKAVVRQIPVSWFNPKVTQQLKRLPQLRRRGRWVPNLASSQTNVRSKRLSNNSGGRKIDKIHSGEKFTKRTSTSASPNPTITRVPFVQIQRFCVQYHCYHSRFILFKRENNVWFSFITEKVLKVSEQCITTNSVDRKTCSFERSSQDNPSLVWLEQ